MKPHPAAAIFPALEGAEFEQLVEDIREHGQREPVIVHDGMILDGRNRWRACEQLGIEPETEDWDGDGTAVAYVISKNLRRRHLTESQRASIAAKLANMPSGYRSDLQPSPNLEKVSVPKAASMMNVSPSTVYNARAVHRDGTPEEVEAMEKGEVAASTLDKQIRKRRTGKQVVTNSEGHVIDGHHRIGARIKVPEGMTAESFTRECIKLASNGKTVEDVAADYGMAATTLRKMRDIILLYDNPDLNERDRKAVERALTDMNETRQVTRNHEQVKPLVEKIWGSGKGQRGKSEKNRLKQFERAYAFVVDACLNARDIDIPYLSAERAKEVAEEVKKAEEAVRTLRKRIMEYANA